MHGTLESQRAPHAEADRLAVGDGQRARKAEADRADVGVGLFAKGRGAPCLLYTSPSPRD